MFLVICRADPGIEQVKGDYVLATHRIFLKKEAAEEYAKSVAECREPIVVTDIELSDFHKLRTT